MDVSMMDPARRVKLKVFRNGQTSDVCAVQVGEMPGKKVERASVNGRSSETGPRRRLGRESGCPNRAPARPAGQHQRCSGDGSRPRQPGCFAGLKEGDVIQEVNHQPVTNSDDLASAPSQVPR